MRGFGRFERETGQSFPAERRDAGSVQEANHLFRSESR